MDKTYHFIGIGGIGMSALARILLQKGAKVRGSDLAASYVTEDLERAGAEVLFDHQSSAIASPMTIVYSTAVKETNPEFAAAVSGKLPILHRAELLAHLMEGREPLLVAGTHGKTTTSALLAHALVFSQLDPSYAIGGIVLNLGTNGGHGQGRYFVAEADESDGSFIKYPGHGAIITSLEDDHLDYWKTREALSKGFAEFAEKIPGPLFWCADEPGLVSLKLKGYSYGLSDKADLKISKWRQEGWKVVFDFSFQGKTYLDVEIPLLGRHNVLNASAVFGMGLVLGLKEEQLRGAFSIFHGVKRRLEKKGGKRGVQVFDDYAHHPTKIRAVLKGLKKAIGDKRLVVAFQPHRYTRTRDLFEEFAQAFSDADEVVLTEIYSAGEDPIEGITGQKLYERMGRGYFAARSQMAAVLSTILRPHDVVITLGAGDITKLSAEILEGPIFPFKVALLTGGKSVEHEVAVSSANVLFKAMTPDYYSVSHFLITKEGEWRMEGLKATFPEIVRELLTFDLIFPVVHGPLCEDGMLQGFFDTLGIPYVGPSYRAGAITMDKAWTKRVAASHGVKVADFIEYFSFDWEQKREEILQTLMKKFRFPFFVKPVHLGSTIGVSKVANREGLEKAIDQCCALDYKFLAEEEILGREMEFGFVGDHDLIVTDPAEVVRGSEIYSYEGKYGSNPTPTILRVPLPEEVRREGKRCAELVYRITECSGMARIDFFLKEDGTWILNEVNPIPGCTPTSIYPKFWPAEGLQLSQVIDRMVIAALHRNRYQSSRLRPP